MNDATKIIKFAESLNVPTGRRAGEKIELAGFQKRFIKGAFAKSVSVGALSIGRGNGKSALSAIIALAEIIGVLSDQPEREVLIAARTQEQAKIAWGYVTNFIDSLPDHVRKNITIRRQPRFEIQFNDENGRHLIRAIAADGKSSLGSSPTLAILDERGHWPHEKGDELEAAILTGLAKRDGRALIISTSAPDDLHPFSQWMDRDAPHTYRQEHRPPPDLPADDIASLKIANPGSIHGIGPSIKRLQEDAKLAISRGGAPLANFRLFSRNERVSIDNRSVLLTRDEWLACETNELPPREGSVVIGIDLGGSASMSAAAYFWPETGRLEAHGCFPSQPTLINRGQSDAVADLYCQMNDRGELITMGDKTVPIKQWLKAVFDHVDGEHIASVTADRFKQSEIAEALDAIGNRSPVIWRGMGWRDGSEDVERFRRAVFDQKVSAPQSFLLRSAFGEAVVLIDPAGNSKIVKGRSFGRIDAACATVLAVAEGVRLLARPMAKTGRVIWA